MGSRGLSIFALFFCFAYILDMDTRVGRSVGTGKSTITAFLYTGFWLVIWSSSGLLEIGDLKCHLGKAGGGGTGSAGSMGTEQNGHMF